MMASVARPLVTSAAVASVARPLMASAVVAKAPVRRSALFISLILFFVMCLNLMLGLLLAVRVK